MKFFKKSGKVSKTIVTAWLQILSALLLAVAEFVNIGNFSTYAVILFANGVVMLVLRHFTSEPLSE